MADIQITWPWQTYKSHDHGRHINHMTIADIKITWPWQTYKSHDHGKHRNHMTMADIQITWPWQTYKSHDHDNQCANLPMAWLPKNKRNVNIKLWDFDCLHFDQYILICQHGNVCKQIWCKEDQLNEFILLFYRLVYTSSSGGFGEVRTLHRL